jgi:hypothetical protein
MSTAPSLDELGHDYEQKLNVSPRAVVTQWAAMTALSIVVLLAL